MIAPDLTFALVGLPAARLRHDKRLNLWSAIACYTVLLAHRLPCRVGAAHRLACII